jgi:hypothetical protein
MMDAGGHYEYILEKITLLDAARAWTWAGAAKWT